MKKQTLLTAAAAADCYLAASQLAKLPGLHASLRYALAPLVRDLDGPYKDLIEGEMLLLDRYAEKDETGSPKQLTRRTEAGEEVPVPNQFKIREGSLQEYFVERSDLLSQEVVLEYLPIDMEKHLDRLDAAGVEIPEGVFEALWPLFLTD